MYINLYNDGVGYVTNEHTRIKANEANLSHKNRVIFVVEQAIVSRNLDPKEYFNPESVRWKPFTQQPNSKVTFSVPLASTEIGEQFTGAEQHEDTTITNLTFKHGEGGRLLRMLSNDECDEILFSKMEKIFFKLMEEAAPNSIDSEKILCPKCDGLGYKEILGSTGGCSPTDPFDPVDYEKCNHCGGSGKMLQSVASRPLEFCPVFIPAQNIEFEKNNDSLVVAICNSVIDFYDFQNKIVKYSYTNENGLYTNLRALVNAGIQYENIPFGETNGFVALKAKIPMFVWAQAPMTHTALSKESQSDRVSTESDYWLPADLEKRITNMMNTKGVNFKYFDLLATLNSYPLIFSGFSSFRDWAIEILLTQSSQSHSQDFFKELGYKKEIYQRAMYYFKYKTVIMTGWNTDPSVWSHLLLQRNAYPTMYSDWTQEETKDFVVAISKIINSF